MCVDFVTACTPTFIKGWDIGLADVQTADLFTDLPTETSRTYRVSAEEHAGVQVGDAVFLRPLGDTVSVVCGRSAVGTIRRPPPPLTDRIAGAGRGIATGTVSKLYPRSGDFDVRVN